MYLFLFSVKGTEKYCGCKYSRVLMHCCEAVLQIYENFVLLCVENTPKILFIQTALQTVFTLLVFFSTLESFLATWMKRLNCQMLPTTETALGNIFKRHPSFEGLFWVVPNVSLKKSHLIGLCLIEILWTIGSGFCA